MTRNEKRIVDAYIKAIRAEADLSLRLQGAQLRGWQGRARNAEARFDRIESALAKARDAFDALIIEGVK